MAIDKLRIFALYCEISSYRQGSSSVATYFSKLEELWEEQSALLAIPTCGCDSFKAHAELSEQQKLFRFLMGLNDSYGQARSQILLMVPLPSVNVAYGMIIQDETQKSIAVKKDTEPIVLALTPTETVNHPRHCHPLRLKGEEVNPFECSGCKDLGFGPRYQCEENDCSFVLHVDCFKARDTDPSKTHAFMGNCRFQFLWEPPGGPKHRRCDACGRDVRGFLYHDKYKHKLDLHPCCMNLESTICDPSGTMKLILKDNAPSKCVKCKEPFKGWSYVSSCGNYSYPVYCVKELIIYNWKRGYFNVASSSSSTSLGVTSISRDITASSSRSSEQIFKSSSSTSSSLSLARRRSKSSSTRWLIKIAKISFSVIVSVLLGNPTPLFTALAEKLLD